MNLLIGFLFILIGIILFFNGLQNELDKKMNAPKNGVIGYTKFENTYYRDKEGRLVGGPVYVLTFEEDKPQIAEKGEKP